MLNSTYLKRMQYFKFLNGFIFVALIIMGLSLTGCDAAVWFTTHPEVVSDAEQIAKDAAVAAGRAAETDVENDLKGSSQPSSKS